MVVVGVASNFRRAKNTKKAKKDETTSGLLEISQLTRSADFSGKGAFAECCG